MVKRSLVDTRQVRKPRCAYCNKTLTQSYPRGLNTPLARYPHSPEPQEIPPLCFTSRWVQTWGQIEQAWFDGLRDAMLGSR